MIKLNIRLIFIFLIISVIPLFLISYLALYQTRKMITVGTLGQLEQAVSINKSKLLVIVAEGKKVIGDFSKDIDLSKATEINVKSKDSLLPESINKNLAEKKLQIEGIKSLFIVNLDGKVLASSESEEIASKKDYLLSAGFLKGSTNRTDFILDDEKELVLVSSQTLGSAGSGFGAKFILERDGNFVLSAMEESIGLGNSFEFILATRDKNGDSLYVTPSRFDQAGPLRRATPADDFSQSVTLALAGKENTFENLIDWRGKQVLSATRFINETGWGLVAKKDRDETYLPIYKLTSLLLAIGIVAVVIIVLISLSAATSIVSPIKRLIMITGKISGGDLSQRAIVESKDEIGLLELAFNQMAAKLKESYGNLENKVTERTKELEIIRKNLEHANENLRELDKLKDEFVSVASHELRTPMTAIRGLISMIFEGDFGPVSKNLEEPLGNIATSTQRLIVLVNDMLNISRIETGRLKIALADFDIEPVVGEMIEQMMPIAIEKGLSLEAVDGKPAFVQADKDKVREILNNLIGNALKFTVSGGVSVSISVDEDEVKLFIKDTGIGVSRKDQEKLFGKFNQITSQQDGKPAGSGLGLYISRELARKMGGALWIEDSKLGHGSVFAFSLPKSQTPMAKAVFKKIEEESNTISKRQELLAKIVEDE